MKSFASTETTNEPSYDDLVRAWGAAVDCEGMGGSRMETRLELVRLRNLKTTWYGKAENDLRFSIDAYLRDKA